MRESFQIFFIMILSQTTMDETKPLIYTLINERKKKAIPQMAVLACKEGNR